MIKFDESFVLQFYASDTPKVGDAAPSNQQRNTLSFSMYVDLYKLAGVCFCDFWTYAKA